MTAIELDFGRGVDLEARPLGALGGLDGAVDSGEEVGRFLLVFLLLLAGGCVAATPAPCFFHGRVLAMASPNVMRVEWAAKWSVDSGRDEYQCSHFGLSLDGWRHTFCEASVAYHSKRLRQLPKP